MGHSLPPTRPPAKQLRPVGMSRGPKDPVNEYVARYLKPQMSDGPIPFEFHLESFASTSGLDPRKVNRRAKGTAELVRAYDGRSALQSMAHLPGLHGDFHSSGSN